MCVGIMGVVLVDWPGLLAMMVCSNVPPTEMALSIQKTIGSISLLTTYNEVSKKPARLPIHQFTT